MDNSLANVARMLSEASRILLETASTPVTSTISPTSTCSTPSTSTNSSPPTSTNTSTTLPNSTNPVMTPQTSNNTFIPIAARIPLSSSSALFNPLQSVSPLLSRMNGGRMFSPSLSVPNELRRAFSPYPRANERHRRSGKQKAKIGWNHKFCVIPYHDFQEVPSRYMKEQWAKSGLGEKNIYFPDRNGGQEDLCNCLLENFPKLSEGGGFMLYRSGGRGNSSSQLEPIEIPSNGYSIPYLRLDSPLNSAVCYIKPLQQDLDVSFSDVVEEEVIKVACIHCHIPFTYKDIVLHISQCSERPSLQTENQATENGSGSSTRRERRQYDSDDSDLPEVDVGRHVNTMGVTLSKFCSQAKEEGSVTLRLDREVVLASTMSKLKARKLEIRKEPEIIFKDEPGIDANGLKKEYFYLLSSRITNGQEMMIFEGQDGHKVPVHQTDHLLSEVFFYIGKIISYITIHSSVGIIGISPAIIHNILYDDVGTTITLEDLPDYDVREIVKELMETESVEQVQASSFDDRTNVILQNAGFTDILTMGNKRTACETVLLHEVLLKRHKEIAQLRDGLKEINLLTFLKNNESATGQVFPSFAILTTAELQENLNMPDCFSEEEEKIKNWFVTYTNNLTGEDSQDVNVKKFVLFCCGEPCFPEHGIKVRWLPEGREGVDADSCVNTIYISKSHESEENFIRLLNGVISCQFSGYGRV